MAEAKLRFRRHNSTRADGSVPESCIRVNFTMRVRFGGTGFERIPSCDPTYCNETSILSTLANINVARDQGRLGIFRGQWVAGRELLDDNVITFRKFPWR